MIWVHRDLLPPAVHVIVSGCTARHGAAAGIATTWASQIVQRRGADPQAHIFAGMAPDEPITTIGVARGVSATAAAGRVVTVLPGERDPADRSWLRELAAMAPASPVGLAIVAIVDAWDWADRTPHDTCTESEARALGLHIGYPGERHVAYPEAMGVRLIPDHPPQC